MISVLPDALGLQAVNHQEAPRYPGLLCHAVAEIRFADGVSKSLSDIDPGPPEDVTLKPELS